MSVAGSARSPSARPTPTPTRSPSSEIGQRAAEAQALGATEVCLQGGIYPALDATAYADIVRAVKAAAPGIHVHAFSPMEIATASAKAGHVAAGVARGGQGRRSGLDPGHRGGDPGRRGAVGPDQGQAPRRAVGRDRRHGARARHPEQQHDDVRPRRPPAPLGGPPAHPRDPAGPHRWVHRVRAAAVRPHQRPGLPRRPRPPGTDAARQPRGARGGAADAARPDPQRADLLGQARRRRHAGDAPAAVPTTWAAR